jgi:hypothetical protein
MVNLLVSRVSQLSSTVEEGAVEEDEKPPIS